MHKLSIIIPVYNEKRTIEKILEKVGQSKVENAEKEVIIIDDFSTDGTREILKTFEGKFKILYQEKNYGKGAAVKRGLKEMTGDLGIIQDADLEYDPDEYGILIDPILKGQADIVYGSRFMGSQPHRILYFWHYAGNKIITLFSNMLTNLNLTDMETCYKAFNREVALRLRDKLKSKRFGIEPEITSLVKKFRVYEVGISYYGRTYKEGKHLNWKDGIAAIWFITKYNLFK